MKLFLGGTCSGSTWRRDFVKMIPQGISFFNPVVEKWTDECFEKEFREKLNSDYIVYIITPEGASYYSVAEMVDSTWECINLNTYENNRHPGIVLCCFVDNYNGRFNDKELKSIDAVKMLLIRLGARVFNSMSELAYFVSDEYRKESNGQISN